MREVFDEACTTYMMWGMTYDEFWHGDPYLATYYRKAYRKKAEEHNHHAWLQGLYVYYAIRSVASEAFSKRGASHEKYPDKPLELFKAEKAEEAPKDNSEAVFSLLEAMMAASNKE